MFGPCFHSCVLIANDLDSLFRIRVGLFWGGRIILRTVLGSSQSGTERWWLPEPATGTPVFGSGTCGKRPRMGDTTAPVTWMTDGNIAACWRPADSSFRPSLAGRNRLPRGRLRGPNGPSNRSHGRLRTCAAKSAQYLSL